MIKNDFIIRRMTAQDIQMVHEIELATQIAPWEQTSFADCIRVGYDCWVAEQPQASGESEIVGFGIISIVKSARESHIMNLCVKPEYQHQGIGRGILKRLIASAEGLADQTILEVRRSNASALKLYEGMGFNVIGERKNYYPSPSGREDAIMLALCLII